MPGLLALLAHPDDEFFCGGLLAALTARGVPVHLVYWTRGEGGGSPRARLFWKYFPAGWRPRVREVRRVAELLPASSLSFLGSIDPAPDPNPRAPTNESSVILEKLGRLLSLHAPEMVVTHGSGGEYGHPAHQRLHQLARELVGRSPQYPLLSFNAVCLGGSQAGFINADDPADFVLDTQPYFEKKRRVVQAYRSQRGLFEGLAGTDGTLDGLMRVTRYEGYRCWSEKDVALEKLGRWTGAEGRPV